jgi:CRP-like cAMP-binding protein
MYNFFLESLRKYINLSDQEAELLISKVHFKKVRKRQWIVTPGHECKVEFFVNKGVLRAYYPHDNGNQYTTKFAPEGWWISDVQSLFNGEPATQYIEPLEDSEVIGIPKPNMDLLYEEIPQLNKYFRLVYQKALANSSERVLRTISDTTHGHYIKFLAQYPNLEQRVPQYMIASYLGVTPEFFSKLKAQVMKSLS